MKRIIAIVLIVGIIASLSAVIVSGTTMNSTTSYSYSTTYPATDVNGMFSFTQGDITWSGYTKNYWPSNHLIYYCPVTKDYTQAGPEIIFPTAGTSSGNIYYNSGYGYRSQYRVRTHTSTSSADTTFSFFV